MREASVIELRGLEWSIPYRFSDYYHGLPADARVLDLRRDVSQRALDYFLILPRGPVDDGDRRLLAVAFGKLGFYGFWSMMVFLAVLTIGFIYEWRKGALEWD